MPQLKKAPIILTGLLLCFSNLGAATKYLPLVGVGGDPGLNLTTILYLTNPASTPMTGTVQLYDSEGREFAVRIDGSEPRSFFLWTLSPNASRRFVLKSQANDVESGWARINTNDSALGVHAVLKLMNGDSLLAEAGVLPARASHSFSIPRDLKSGGDTGLALANTNPA